MSSAEWSLELLSPHFNFRLWGPAAAHSSRGGKGGNGLVFALIKWLKGPAPISLTAWILILKWTARRWMLNEVLSWGSWYKHIPRGTRAFWGWLLHPSTAPRLFVANWEVLLTQQGSSCLGCRSCSEDVRNAARQRGRFGSQNPVSAPSGTRNSSTRQAQPGKRDVPNHE